MKKENKFIEYLDLLLTLIDRWGFGYYNDNIYSIYRPFYKESYNKDDIKINKK